MTALVSVPAERSLPALPRYEAMRDAVALCASVDEAREIKDRAEALAAYARLRDDRQLMVWAQEIRLRAGRRIGEILRDIERQRSGRPKAGIRPGGGPSLITRAIQDAGLRRGPAYELQEIAGPRDTNLKAIADAAAEGYFAQAQAVQEPATQAGLKIAVISAVHAALGPDEIARVAKRFRRERQAQKAEKRVDLSQKLADRTRAAAAELGRTLYPVVYVDFPWRDEAWSEETGLDRSPGNHYPTMSDEEVMAFRLPAGPTAIVYMWATVPKLDVAMAAMRGFGFSYKSLWAWHKPTIGLGRYGRENLELLLIGTRGGMMAPLPGDQPPMAQMAPRGRRHSEKPALFADCIARIYPHLPKIELFARGPRPGWDVWGNEADGAAA